MNKNMKIVLAVALVAVAIAIVLCLVFKDNTTESSIKFETQADVEAVITGIYEKIDTSLMPATMQQALDLADADMIKMNTGVLDANKIEIAVVSDPMMSSQAYSLVLVKVKDESDVETVKKEMVDNIDTRKWICVEAEKVYATNYKNLICLVMSSEDRALPVYNAFKDLAGNNIGKELTKSSASAEM